MSTPKLKLSYFPIGGRSMPVKVALKYADIPFEFEGIPFEQWFGQNLQADRKRFPLGDIPVLDIDGTVMCEANAIYSYIGQLTGLWPTKPFDISRAFEVLITVEQFFTGMTYGPNDCNFIGSMAIQDPEAKKAARAGACTDRVRIYIGRINDIVAANPSGYCAGDKLSIVDIAISEVYLGISHGRFDDIPASSVEGFSALKTLATEKLPVDEKISALIKAESD